MRKLAALVLIALGVLVLVVRGFTWTTHHKTDLKIVQLDVEEKERHEIPVWVGVVLVAAGTAALALPSRRNP